MDYLWWNGTDLMGAAQQALAGAGGGFTPLAGATTWNPSDKSASITLSNGNLTALGTSSSGGVRAVQSRSSGLYYWEVTINVGAGGSCNLGAIGTGDSLTGITPGSGFNLRGGNGTLVTPNGNFGGGAGVYTTGDVIMFAVNLASTLVYVGKNGSWIFSTDPNAQTGGINYGGSPLTVKPWYSPEANTAQATANFGATAFVYPVPTGFTAGFA